MLNDEQIRERGGTDEDIADYAHDVGFACMYPEYDCDICKKRFGKNYKVIGSYDPVLFARTQEIHREFSGFMDGVRVFFLIQRSKEGGSNKGDKLRKVVSRDRFQAIDVVYNLLVEKQRYTEPMRIYMSANPRNMRKAIRNFKQQMLDNDYNADEIQEDFYFDIKNRWISSIMKPSARADTHFIIDCDTDGELASALKELEVVHFGDAIIKQYKTKNGTHIVTRPYNPSWTPSVKEKIHKDGLLLLDF